MNPTASKMGLILITAALFCGLARGQEEEAKPAPTAEDKEAYYADILERRVQDILTAVNVTDAVKQARLKNALLLQYRSLRLRDEVIQTRLAEQEKAGTSGLTRETLLRNLSRPLHDWFVGLLGTDLTPQQLETVKDKMTYNKVKVTFDAYCGIISNLTDADKAKIMELLKLAREEAMDGGSATEKSAIFQKYKDQINAYLDANGHNVAQAYKDWEAKHPASPQASTDAAAAVKPK